MNVSLFNQKKYRDVKEGDIILLDIDGSETKRFFFDLLSKTVSKKSPYKVVSKNILDRGHIGLETHNLFDDSVQDIYVLPYWRAKIYNKT